MKIALGGDDDNLYGGYWRANVAAAHFLPQGYYVCGGV